MRWGGREDPVHFDLGRVNGGRRNVRQCP
jgi:hypothetical protein